MSKNLFSIIYMIVVVLVSLSPPVFGADDVCGKYLNSKDPGLTL